MAALKSNIVLDVLPKAERISSTVFRVLGLNPGVNTLQGTNTYIVGTGEKRVLIDAGESNRPDYIQLLQESLTSLKARLSHIIVTHWHHDHLGGVEAVWKMTGDPYPKVSKLPHLSSANQSKDTSFFNTSIPIHYLSDGDIIKEEGVTLKVVSTPGHTDDHMSLLLNEESALFSGDCVLGQGTAVFDDLKDYVVSLQKIKRLNPILIYPGHGPVLANPVSTIEAYIQNRMNREKQILELLQSSSKVMSSLEIVEILYKEVPRKFWKSANGNVLLHLQKLCTEELVENIDGKYLIKT